MDRTTDPRRGDNVISGPGQDRTAPSEGDRGLTPLTVGVPYRDEGQPFQLIAGALAAALEALPSEQPREVLLCVNGSPDGFAEKLGGLLSTSALLAHGARIVTSSPGKLAAQRVIVRERRLRGYLAFTDSDVVLQRNVLRRLSETLNADSRCMVAYGQPVPVFPRERSLVHDLLRVHYSLRDHAYRRPYFHGRTFMVREWFLEDPAPSAPPVSAIARRLRLGGGPLVDDIALSRMAVARWGTDAVREVPEANVYFDPPDTVRALYAAALRVALEVRRLDHLYPEHSDLQERVFNAPWQAEKLSRFSRRLRTLHGCYRVLDSALKKAAWTHAWLVERGFLDVTTHWVSVPGTKRFPDRRRDWSRFGK